MDEKEIIERIMTQHWDMVVCPCWICVAGRALGLHPREAYHPGHEQHLKLAQVHVTSERR